jgi:hypothetical protein
MCIWYRATLTHATDLTIASPSVHIYILFCRTEWYMPSRSKLLCCLYFVQNCISLAYRSAFTLCKMVAMQIMCRDLCVVSVCIPTFCRMVSHFSLCAHFVQNGSSFVSLYPLCIKWYLISLSMPTLYKMVFHFCLGTHFVQNGMSFPSAHHFFFVKFLVEIQCV